MYIAKLVAIAVLAFSTSAGAEEPEGWVRLDSWMAWGFIEDQDAVPPILEHIRIQLHSQNRPGVTWGPYSLKDLKKTTNPWNGNMKFVEISCKEDEVICYGAWTEDYTPEIVWGVGHGSGRCSDSRFAGPRPPSCCYRCDGRPHPTALWKGGRSPP
jgi:hypothetical protein